MEQESKPRILVTGDRLRLVSFYLTMYESSKFLDAINYYIKELVRSNTSGFPGPNQYLGINRASRLGYQLSNNNCMENLSKEDLHFLSRLKSRLTDIGPDIYNAIDTYKNSMQSDGPVGIVEADRMAKDFERIMTD